MSAHGSDFAGIMDRELGRLEAELRAYRDEDNLWVMQGAQKNAPGTLALHLVGNLMAFVGADLGGTGYVRDREAEFGDRDVSRGELLGQVAECRRMLASVLPEVPANVMDGPHPGKLPEHMAGFTTHHLLVNLTWHLGWHLGHIYYHRLAVEGGQPELP